MTSKERAKIWRSENLAYAKAKDREKYQKNKDKIKARAKLWRENNLERAREIHRIARAKWRKNNPEKVKELRDIRRYKETGFTPEMISAKLALQKGCCAICGRVLSRVFPDHCHKSLKPRGLLCSPCNLGIGLLGDSSKVLFRAFEYLQKAEQN